MKKLEVSLKACPHCGSTDLEQEQYIKLNPVDLFTAILLAENHEPTIYCNGCDTHPSLDALETVTLVDPRPIRQELADIEAKLYDLRQVVASDEDGAEVQAIQKQIKKLAKSLQS